MPCCWSTKWEHWLFWNQSGSHAIFERSPLVLSGKARRAGTATKRRLLLDLDSYSVSVCYFPSLELLQVLQVLEYISVVLRYHGDDKFEMWDRVERAVTQSRWKTNCNSQRFLNLSTRKVYDEGFITIFSVYSISVNLRRDGRKQWRLWREHMFIVLRTGRVGLRGMHAGNLWASLKIHLLLSFVF